MTLQKLKWNDKIPVYKHLASICGIGTSMSIRLCSLVGIGKHTIASQVDGTVLEYLKERIKRTISVDKKLKTEVKQHIQLQKQIGTYRGIRHNRHLPVRGQSTRRPKKKR